MSKIEVTGMEEYLSLLDLTDRKLARTCGRSIYVGARIAAQECKHRLENLVTDDRYFTRFTERRNGPTKRQKEALIESMGIASMRHRGGVFDVKLGFDGYNDVKSTVSKKGFQPNALIARSVNKGTSFMKPQPFMDQTIAVKKSEIEKAIAEQFFKELEKLWDKL